MVGIWNFPAHMFAVRLDPGIIIKNYYKKYSADNLSIDHLISNSQGPYEYIIFVWDGFVKMVYQLVLRCTGSPQAVWIISNK